MEEICLGIACTYVVSELVLPRPVGPQLRGGLDKWLGDAAGWAGEVLRGEGHGPAATANKLAGDAAALGVLRIHAGYEFAEPRRSDGWVRALQERMLLLLPLLVSLEDWLGVLRSGHVGAFAEMRPLLDRYAAWFALGLDGQEPDAAGPNAALAETWGQLGQRSDNEALAVASVLVVLVELGRTWAGCLTLRREALRPGRTSRPPRVVSVRYRDPVLAALPALVAVLATLSAGAIWILTAWPDGGTATLVAAVVCALFAAQDELPAVLSGLARWVVVGSAMALIYLYGVLPGIDGFPLLAFSLGATLLPLGAVLAMPGGVLTALPVIFGLVALLAIEETYAASLPASLNAALAEVGGICIAAAVSRIVRPVGAALAVRRLLAGGRRDLERLFREPDVDFLRFAGRTLDRLGALAPRVAGKSIERNAGLHPLADLRAGYHLLRLQAAQPELPTPAQAIVRRALAQLEGALKRRPALSTAELSERLADEQAALAGLPASTATFQAALALAGLRRVLAPAKPTRPPAPDLPTAA